MTAELAVITGASGGIGSAIARTVHCRSGGELRLVLQYRNHREACEALAAEIPGAVIVQADLSTNQGRNALVETALSLGVPWLLVNNAGIDRPHEPALQITEDAFDRIVGLNLKASLLLMASFAREMAREEDGVIVNISSVLARHSLVGSAVYGIAKAGLEAATRFFADELSARGIRVCAVAPGLVDTPMTTSLSPESLQRVLERLATPTPARPEEVAEAVWSLVEDDSANGVVLDLTGAVA